MRLHEAKLELLTSAVVLELLIAVERFNTAAEYRRRARCSEANGYPYTAAVQWRIAANLFRSEDWLAEKCWQAWERIMDIPRKFSQPIT